MKILYVGNERRSAQAVATALRGVARNVTLLWTPSLDHCATSLQENPDLAALVMEAEVHAGKWPASLKDLRSLQIRPAIVVVVPEGTRPKLESLGPPPDGYVTNGQTFLRDLPVAVSSAITRVRGSQPPSSAPSDDAEPQQASAVTAERVEDNARVHRERAALGDLEQKLSNVTAALQDARERHAATLAAALVAHERAAIEQLTAQEREFQAQAALELEKRHTVEEMLAEAASALDDTEKRYAAAQADAEAQTRELERARALAAELGERQARLDRELSQTVANRDQLGERLKAAEAALGQARRESKIAAGDIVRLQQQGTDLSAQVANLQTVRGDLERQLIDRSRALEQAGQREAELVEQSQHQRAMRAALEQAVADAHENAHETGQRHEAALTAAADELAEHRAQFELELSRKAVECGALTARLNEAELALRQSRQAHESAAADVARLTHSEADLSAQLVHADGARLVVDRKLFNALRELGDARQSAAHERDAAEKRQADRELRLVQEIEARENLERTLNETRSAAVDSERRFREETEALRAHGLEREAHFSRLASERLEYENRLAEMHNACERLGQARAAADEEVQRLSADLSEAKRVLDDTYRQSQITIERLSAEHATALAGFAILLALNAERDERLKEQAVRHDAALRASEMARAELQEQLQALLAADRDEMEQMQEKLMATVAALESTKRRRQVLQTEVDRSSELHEQRDESRAKNLISVRVADPGADVATLSASIAV